MQGLCTKETANSIGGRDAFQALDQRRRRCTVARFCLHQAQNLSRRGRPEPRVRPSTHLEVEGYEVFVENDGIAAARMFDATYPDLVILDIMLPGIDGIELLP